MPVLSLWQSFPVVTVNTSEVYQEFFGCGAALTDTSAWLLSGFREQDPSYPVVPAPVRAALLRTLFDADAGFGLRVLRLPLGTSDFRWADYTYDDSAGAEPDPALRNFSLAADERYILPVLREILAVNPALKVLARLLAVFCFFVLLGRYRFSNPAFRSLPCRGARRRGSRTRRRCTAGRSPTRVPRCRCWPRILPSRWRPTTPRSRAPLCRPPGSLRCRCRTSPCTHLTRTRA